MRSRRKPKRMAVCVDCKQEFHARLKVSIRCQPCLQQSYRGRYKYPYQRNEYLKKVYGITLQDYEAMFTKQQGRCAICSGEPQGKWNRFHVDHCHTTGTVRGLLCNGCNLNLGHFERFQIESNRVPFEQYLNRGITHGVS